MRCTYCYDEIELSLREINQLIRQNFNDKVCPIKEECHMCHIGFIIPVNYTDKSSKTYKYHEIKPKIINLDPDTVMERIFNNNDQENTAFFYFNPLENMENQPKQKKLKFLNIKLGRLRRQLTNDKGQITKDKFFNLSNHYFDSNNLIFFVIPAKAGIQEKVN